MMQMVYNGGKISFDDMQEVHNFDSEKLIDQLMLNHFLLETIETVKNLPVIHDLNSADV